MMKQERRTTLAGFNAIDRKKKEKENEVLLQPLSWIHPLE
jgi:hypothetical protein